MPLLLKSSNLGINNRFEIDAVWEDRDGNSWRIVLDLKVVGEVKGCGAITITSQTPGCLLTQSLLRQIPMAQIEREAFKAEKPALHRRSQGRGPRSGKPLTDHDLRDIAAAYIKARNQRLPVQAYVAKEFGVALSTAAKRIAAARKRGFIDPDTSTK